MISIGILGRIFKLRPLQGVIMAPSRCNFRTGDRLYCEMNDPFEHATGIEKREMLAKAAGIEDPFGLKKIIKRGPSTKEKPTMIPSAFKGRLVGCICHEDQRFVQWMWLESDSPKRCECGYWFQLEEVEPL